MLSENEPSLTPVTLQLRLPQKVEVVHILPSGLNLAKKEGGGEGRGGEEEKKGKKERRGGGEKEEKRGRGSMRRMKGGRGGVNWAKKQQPTVCRDYVLV